MRMASKNIGIKEDVYERLKAHKRGDESFSETLDRILHELDSDWRTNAGFLSDEEAADLETEVSRGLEDVDDSFDVLGDEVDDRLSGES
jgi:predicted CopG family antitoxin